MLEEILLLEIQIHLSAIMPVIMQLLLEKMLLLVFIPYLLIQLELGLLPEEVTR